MSVRQHANGKWYAKFQICGVRKHLLCNGAKTKQQAKVIEARLMSELKEQLDGKAPKIDKNITFKHLSQLYLSYSEINNRSHNNATYYVNIIKGYFGENTEAHKIKPYHVEAFRDWLKTERKLKNSSINRYIEILSKMFNLGIDNEVLAINPVSKVKMLLEDNHKIRFLTKEEEIQLYKELPDYLIPIVTTALQTGMRRGEILSLEWSQVDFELGYIEVLKTKSGKARSIPISDKLRKTLMKLDRTSKYVFVNPKTGLPYVDIKKGYNKAVKDAGIKNLTFHDLRHTVATRMVEKGIDLLVVKDILGHSNIETTMRYAHPVPKRKLEAVESLSSFV